MPTSRRLTLIIAVLVLVDQLTKSWVVSALSDGHVVHLVGSLQFSLGYNSGIAFSQAQGMGVLVAVVALVAVVLLVRAMLRARTPWSAYGLALIASGALGNLADRAFRGDGLLDGHVVDFIDLQWFPSFNVADSAITVGAVMLIVSMVIESRTKEGRPA